MKKFLLATIAAAALVAAGPAMAADMGAPVYKAPPPPAPAPVYNWTGFYVGAGAGYGMWDMDTTTTFPAVGVASSVTNNGGRGWVGQAVAGYDYQFPVASFNLVAGVFGDYDFGHISGTTNVGLAVSPVDTFGGVEKERSSWAVGGRLGWLITPQILTYWNGGYTEARFDGINLTDTGVGIAGPLPPLSVTANTYHGWFTGGGVETQVTAIPGLFFNTEYRYSSYSSATLPVSGPLVAGTPVSLKLEPHVQTVMSGLRYKFNWTR